MKYSCSTNDILSLSLPYGDEQTITIPLSVYKEMLEICKLYRQSQTKKTYIPDPYIPNYTRPLPNDWPPSPPIWC